MAWPRCMYAVPIEIWCLSQRHQSLQVLSSPQPGAHRTTAHAHPVLLRIVAQARALAPCRMTEVAMPMVPMPVLVPLQRSPRTNAHGADACPSPLQCCSTGGTEAKDVPCSACGSDSQGPPTSTKHNPGPRLAASATGIPAFLGPDAHTLVSASTFCLV